MLRTGPGNAGGIPLQRGQAVQFTGQTIHNEKGDWANVITLGGGMGSQEGWVLRSKLKPASMGWASGENRGARSVFDRFVSGALSAIDPGPNQCAHALANALGWENMGADAHRAAAPLQRRGYTSRSGEVQAGDIIIYGREFSQPGRPSSYSSQTAGHIGIAAPGSDGKLHLLSYLEGDWKMTDIGQPGRVMYKP